jgi:hypothetical protein
VSDAFDGALEATALWRDFGCWDILAWPPELGAAPGHH